MLTIENQILLYHYTNMNAIKIAPEVYTVIKGGLGYNASKLSQTYEVYCQWLAAHAESRIHRLHLPEEIKLFIIEQNLTNSHLDMVIVGDELVVYNRNAYNIIKDVVNDKYKFMLRYNGTAPVPKRPVGLSDLSDLFAGSGLPQDFTLEKFNINGVKKMDRMFSHCYLNQNFSIPETWDMSEVESIIGMFVSCRFPKGFKLPDNFDTRHINSLASLFNGVIFNEDFTVGPNFQTSHVTDLSYIFANTQFYYDIPLLHTIDTRSCVNAQGMFQNSQFEFDLILGDNFDFRNCEDMSYMFAYTIFEHALKLGPKFIPAKCKIMKRMFYKVMLPVDFKLNEEFVPSEVTDMVEMFREASFESAFAFPTSFVAGQLKNAYGMFCEAYVINGLDLTNFRIPRTAMTTSFVDRATLPHGFEVKFSFLN